MKNTLRASRSGLPILAMAALLATMDTGLAAAEPVPDSESTKDMKQGDALRWNEDLANANATAAGVHQQDGNLVLDRNRSDRSGAGGSSEGYYTFPARQLARPVNRVSATVTAAQPPGSSVAVDVRGIGPSGRWTEWQPVSAESPVVVPFPVSQVQVRVVLSRTGAESPTVSAVALSADSAPAGSATVQPQAAPTWRIYATREGLVGHTTANGHVIRPNDHFVALPSRRGLNANDQTFDYKVQVCNPRNGRCETAPVFDVGPWNTTDDYWNPSNVRQRWQDLPQGKPEASAAYFQGYNGGRDQFGRQTNGAGIDLADGTWASLGMTGNDFVDVTYLWKG